MCSHLLGNVFGNFSSNSFGKCLSNVLQNVSGNFLVIPMDSLWKHLMELLQKIFRYIILKCLRTFLGVNLAIISTTSLLYTSEVITGLFSPIVLRITHASFFFENCFRNYFSILFSIVLAILFYWNL